MPTKFGRLGGVSAPARLHARDFDFLGYVVGVVPGAGGLAPLAQPLPDLQPPEQQTQSQAEPGRFPENFHDLLVADGFFLKRLVVAHIDGGFPLRQSPEKNLGPRR
jgi:hypothetical protein